MRQGTSSPDLVSLSVRVSRDTADRLQRILPDGDPLITELRQSLADIGEE